MTLALLIAGFASWDAFKQIPPAAPLQLSLPVLASGESVNLEVGNIPSWRAYVSWPGIATAVVGVLFGVWAWRIRKLDMAWYARWIALGMIAVGLLLQTNGAAWFFGLLALIIAVFHSIPAVIDGAKRMMSGLPTGLTDSPMQTQDDPPSSGGNTGSIVTTPIIAFMISLAVLSPPNKLQASTIFDECCCQWSKFRGRKSNSGGKFVDAKVERIEPRQATERIGHYPYRRSPWRSVCIGFAHPQC